MTIWKPDNGVTRKEYFDRHGLDVKEWGKIKSKSEEIIKLLSNGTVII